jgi:hypothetical protein
VAFEPGGEWLFSAGWDGCLVRRDGSTGEAVTRWEGRRGPLYVAAVPADGKWLFAGGFDKTLRLLDAASGDDVGRFYCRGEVRACCPWVRDGALEAAAGDSTGAVYFLRVHGVEMTTARAPSGEAGEEMRTALAPCGEAGEITAEAQAGRGFGRPSFAATPELEGEPKKRPWWKIRRR